MDQITSPVIVTEDPAPPSALCSENCVIFNFKESKVKRWRNGGWYDAVTIPTLPRAERSGLPVHLL